MKAFYVAYLSALMLLCCGANAYAQVDPAAVRGLAPGLYYYFQPGESRAKIHYVPSNSASFGDPFAKPVKPLPIQGQYDFPTLSFTQLQGMTLSDIQARVQSTGGISSQRDASYLPPDPSLYRGRQAQPDVSSYQAQPPADASQYQQQQAPPAFQPMPTMRQQEQMLDAIEQGGFSSPAAQQTPPAQWSQAGSSPNYTPSQPQPRQQPNAGWVYPPSPYSSPPPATSSRPQQPAPQTANWSGTSQPPPAANWSQPQSPPPMQQSQWSTPPMQQSQWAASPGQPQRVAALPPPASPFDSSGRSSSEIQASPVRGLTLEQAQELVHLAQKGSKLVHEKKYSEAIQYLEKAASFGPNVNSGAIYYNLGTAYKGMGNFTQAQQSFSKALQFEPKEEANFWGIADCYDKAGKYSDAIAWYQKLSQIAQRPEMRAEAMAATGSCYQSMGRLSESAAWYERYLQQGSAARDAVNVRKMLAAVQHQAGKGDMVDNPDDPDYFASIRSRGLRRWDQSKLPLRVYVGPGNSTRGFKKEYAGYLINAFNAWTEASGNRLEWVQVEKPEQATVICNWTSGDISHESASGAEGGLCVTTCYKNDDGTDTIDAAKITMRTLTHTGGPVSDQLMIMTALHEVGHAYGLGHSSSNQDIMFFSETSLSATSLSNRDRATIVKLYESYPPLAAR